MQKCVEILRVHSNSRTFEGGKKLVAWILESLKIEYRCEGPTVKKLIPLWTREQKPSVLHLLCDPDPEPPSF